MPGYNDKINSGNHDNPRDHQRVLARRGVGIDPWAEHRRGHPVIRKAKLRRHRSGHYMVLDTPPLSPRGGEAL